MITPIPKPRPRKAEQAEKRREHALATAELRAKVMERAGGKCECWIGCSRRAEEMDHMLGAGRRRSHQSEANTWFLSRSCHRSKTENSPSREVWVRKMETHLRIHGYPTLSELRMVADLRKRGAP